MPKIPPDFVAYHRTQSFTATSVPERLTTQHSTKPGVWGLVVVERGSLDFVETGRGPIHIAQGQTAVIQPDVSHYVALAPDAQFYVELYRRPRDGAKS